MTNADPDVNRSLHGHGVVRSAVPARDAARTRARILAAAQEAFSAHDYASARLREIASAAGVNVALVARYFGGKDRLFEAALDDLLASTTLWAQPRATFGQSLVDFFVRNSREASNPLPMLMQATTDPLTKSIALKLIETRLLAPLATWLGPPDAEARATGIIALCAGFFSYRIMLPLPCFVGAVDPAARLWLEQTLQALVDRR